jgi:hypothetical protein
MTDPVYGYRGSDRGELVGHGCPDDMWEVFKTYEDGDEDLVAYVTTEAVAKRLVEAGSPKFVPDDNHIALANALHIVTDAWGQWLEGVDEPDSADLDSYGTGFEALRNYYAATDQLLKGVGVPRIEVDHD